MIDDDSVIEAEPTETESGDRPYTTRSLFMPGFFLGMCLASIVSFFIYKPIVGHVKHTGPVSVTAKYADRYIMIRPNREVFEMKFDEDTEPYVCVGAKFDDISYKDVGENTRHFVSAKVAEPPAQDTIVDQFGRVYKLQPPKDIKEIDETSTSK